MTKRLCIYVIEAKCLPYFAAVGLFHPSAARFNRFHYLFTVAATRQIMLGNMAT